jgi:hypothetical protein
VKPHQNPCAGQWQCKTCSRTFSRLFSACAYCPTGDAVVDDWRCLAYELAVSEGKVPWAVEGRAVERANAKPPSEVLGKLRKRRGINQCAHIK